MMTTTDAFVEKTSLLIEVLVDQVLTETAATLTPTQQEWFTDHCEQRFRWFHANNLPWRRWLENRNPRLDPRDQCKVWIRHWLAAFIKNPEQYQERHAACPACGSTEWYKNRSDGFVWMECDTCSHKIILKSPGECA